jgi:hypothetical protein
VRRYSAASNFQQFSLLPANVNWPQEPWYLTFRATNPRTLAYQTPQLTGAANGDHFNVAWPAGYVGWQLQVQTNSLGGGIGSNWVNVAASIATNYLSLPRDRDNSCVLYRLSPP